MFENNDKCRWQTFLPNDVIFESYSLWVCVIVCVLNVNCDKLSHYHGETYIHYGTHGSQNRCDLRTPFVKQRMIANDFLIIQSWSNRSKSRKGSKLLWVSKTPPPLLITVKWKWLKTKTSPIQVWWRYSFSRNINYAYKSLNNENNLNIMSFKLAHLFVLSLILYI